MGQTPQKIYHFHRSIHRSVGYSLRQALPPLGERTKGQPSWSVIWPGGLEDGQAGERMGWWEHGKVNGWVRVGVGQSGTRVNVHMRPPGSPRSSPHKTVMASNYLTWPRVPPVNLHEEIMASRSLMDP